MKVGIPKETFKSETRVALTPATAQSLIKAGLQVCMEKGAGQRAGLADEAYANKGVKIVSGPEDVFTSDIVLQVRTIGTNPNGGSQSSFLKKGQTVIGFGDPLRKPDVAKLYADRHVEFRAMELIPRTSRAQSMDALSSMASLAGYKAILLGANRLHKVFPMMMTAAGTIQPAKVFVLGAGVAGLQAIATAKRLGAVVSAYDIRPAVKQEVESLGAKFVELPLETGDAQDKGGYAKEQKDEFIKKQQELMIKTLSESDLVVTTADIPGRKAPILITADMVKEMAPHSVIVDMAAQNGGNCELTKPDEDVLVNEVLILGPSNIPALLPFHASQMYAKNVSTFLLHLFKEGNLTFDPDDPISKETLVTHDGEVIHPKVKELLQSSANNGGN